MIKLRYTLLKGALILLMMVTACNPSQKMQQDKIAEATDTVIDAAHRNNMNIAGVEMDGSQKSFIISTYSQSLFGVELAKIANKSKYEKLRILGQNVMADYQKMNLDLEKIAQGKGLFLKRNLSSEQQKAIEILKTLSSPALEQQVLQQLQSLQAAFTTLFEEGKHLENNSLKNYAINTSAIVRRQQTATISVAEILNRQQSLGIRLNEVSVP